jgi:hypothetical protein
MSQKPAFTADEQKLNDLWNEHVRAGLDVHSPDETIATMVANPRQRSAGDDRRRWQGRAVRVLRQIFLAADPAGFLDSPGVADHQPWEGGR